MNSVMRQYYEQDTDVVIVDTGDSYEGICNYFEGTYISYSKEKPISMNPFKITELEYEENFGEKKNFLKSLVFQLFKGTDYPTKIEDTIINQTITEYYEAYFHPFEKFSTKERSQLKEMLLLEDKKNGKYDQYEQEMEERYDRIMGKRRLLPEMHDSLISSRLFWMILLPLKERRKLPFISFSALLQS